MPSFAIPKFIILLEPLWVSAVFLLLSTGPQKYGIFRAERSWQIFEIIDRLFALPINLFTILRIMPLINSHPLDLFRVSACRLDDNGGFLAYAPSPLLDIFAIFATINLGGLLCVSRMK